jgi:hypothetical protein
MVDSKLGMQCAYGLAIDRTVRCLPTAVVRQSAGAYSDPGCKTPVFEAPKPGCTVPEYVIEDSTTAGNECTGGGAHTVRKVARTYTRVYRMQAGGCTASDVVTSPVAYVDIDRTPFPPTEFVQATSVDE